MSRLYLSVIIVVVGLTCFSATSGQAIGSKPARTKTFSGVAIPGKSVGELKLGDTRERFWQLFPKKGTDEQYDYPGLAGCPEGYGDAHWLPPKFDDNGIFVYSINDKIVQIADHSPQFPTTKGIRPAMVRTPLESSPQAVRQAYPGIDKTLVILDSGAKVVGGRDLVFWVDTKSGIAFEFQYFANRNRRFLAAIYIFEAGAKFIPQACVSEPQTLREIKLFSLEPPATFKRGHINGVKPSI
jgi:hypothetical protein